MSSPIWITPAGSLGTIPDEEFYQFILNVYDTSQTPQIVQGTLTFTELSKTVIGDGSQFTADLEVGDRLISEYDVVLGIVGEIVSNTELKLFQDATFTASNVIARSADNITFSLISGELPVGLHIDQFGNMSGVPINGEIEGVPAPVSVVTTSTFTIRATNRSGKIADRTFSLTVAGVNPITMTPKNISLGFAFDGDFFSYQLYAYNYRPTSTVVWSVDNFLLPPGLSLSSTGLLRGYILPESVGPTDDSVVYSFKISVTDGYTIDTSNFTITVYNRALFTADSGDIHTDNEMVDISIANKYTPVLYNFDTTIDTATQGNYYAYQFVGRDFNNDPIAYTISESSEDQLPSGLNLDPNTGWISGVVPYGALSVTSYNLTIRLTKTTPGLTEYYVEREFSLPVVSQISDSTIWVTDSYLGAINNGDISTFAVSAYTPSNRSLQYRVVGGELPAGLSLTVEGLIVGRVGFEVFLIDRGATTFNDGTTFDQTHNVTIETYSSDLLVVGRKDFTIRVAATNIKPYENLYIRALPTREQRNTYAQIINNTDIFAPANIYRAGDPWFGKNITLRSLFLTGLNPMADTDYVSAMTKNHYRKTLAYGNVKTARALDQNFNIKYEVVYVDLVDESANASGQSAPMDITVPTNSAGITHVYPNSFDNMRDRITSNDAIGYANKSILPEWMTSRQADGRVLGFTRALVLCYTQPGKSSEIAYRVSQVIDDLRLVGYTIDRYEWDIYLSAGYDKSAGEFLPGSQTEFTDSVDTGMEYLKYPDVVISTNLTEQHQSTINIENTE